LFWGLGISGTGEDVGKGVGGWVCKYCVHMYVNGKTRLVETIPGMKGWGIKGNEGRGEFDYDIFCKSFCKYYNVPQHNTKFLK
jgi:hypothetical protein